MVADEGGNK